MAAGLAEKQMTWEEAVAWLRAQPEQTQQDLVKWCYFDDPLIAAAQRYYDSEEWHGVRTLAPANAGRALDLGAGRGISSFSLAKDGWQVTALEPDKSALVGAGAIKSLANDAGIKIDVISEFGADFPLESGFFDLVYGRQVLHHAPDLKHFLKEIARVLKPGARFIATREHVLSRKEDLNAFLDSHPLHHLYGGENAYLLRAYTEAIEGSGLRLTKVLGSYDNVINYFPLTEREVDSLRCNALASVIGMPIANALVWHSGASPLGIIARKIGSRLLTARDKTPGRLYSFVAEKP
jgi:SAM-dependent methyltransferase